MGNENDEEMAWLGLAFGGEREMGRAGVSACFYFSFCFSVVLLRRGERGEEGHEDLSRSRGGKGGSSIQNPFSQISFFFCRCRRFTPVRRDWVGATGVFWTALLHVGRCFLLRVM